jgi:ribosomal protein S12 methylthiotransferase
VGIVSLGCAKNLVDTEVMMAHLRHAGCEFVRDPSQADLILINTCGFIEAAREESIRTILEVAELKKSGRLKRLVVAGCLVQRHAAELRRDLPEVDAFVDLDDLERVVQRALPHRSARPTPRRKSGPAPQGGPETDRTVRAATYLYDDGTPRLLATPPWTAYLKIAEGCDHSCAFCSIPRIRGAFRSRTPESICREAAELARRGVHEINLIAQDSGRFGHDRSQPGGLASLLEALDGIRALRWIRVQYLHPATVNPELIRVMADLPRVLEYVDLPLQHASSDVLARMRRGGSAESHLRLLERFRGAMPEVALRSTLIVGFPGETEADFSTLLDFVREARFDHLGVFSYSHEEGTPAHALADDVPPATKAARRERLMETQQAIVFEKNRAAVGRVVEVLVEGVHPETEHLLVGRTRGQAPEVDSQVLINEGQAEPGCFVELEVTDTAGYDLVGRVLGPAPDPVSVSGGS